MRRSSRRKVTTQQPGIKQILHTWGHPTPSTPVIGVQRIHTCTYTPNTSHRLVTEVERKQRKI